MMRNISKVRVQLSTAVKRPFGCRPIAVVVKLDASEQVVRFGQCVIQCQALAHAFLRSWPALVRRQESIGGPERVITAQARMRWRVERIERNSLLEILPDVFVAGGEKVFPLMASFQIELVRFEISCRTRSNGALFGAS